jgi:hypothetical protein
MNCPSCGSDNTQRLEIIFEQGTNNIETTSKTKIRPTFSVLSTAKAKTRTSGVSMSKSAQKAAPPAKRPYKVPAIVLLVGLVVLSRSLNPFSALGLLLSLAALGVGGFLLFTAIQFNRTSWLEEYATWEKGWMCNKCGNTFTEA